MLHRCDNPPCCNPAHLFLGRQAENMHDMKAKGRGRGAAINPSSSLIRRGEAHPLARLTREAVMAIREDGGPTLASRLALARKYGVHEKSIRNVLCGATWRI